MNWRGSFPSILFFLEVVSEMCFGNTLHAGGIKADIYSDNKGIQTLLERLDRLDNLERRLLAKESQLHQLDPQKSASNVKANEHKGHHNLRKDVRVAFTASLSSTKKGLSAGDAIVFDDVNINLGNGYSSSNGVFTCTNNGNYFFMSSLMSGPTNKISAEIVVDGVAKATVFAQSDANTLNVQSSNSAVAHCTTGQVVFVRVKDGTSVYGDSSSRLSQFTGYLIWED